MSACDIKWAKYQLALGFAVRRRAWNRGFSIRLWNRDLDTKTVLERLIMADDLIDTAIEQCEMDLDDLEATDWGFF